MTAEKKSHKINQEMKQLITCVLKRASNFHEVWEISKEMLLGPKIKGYTSSFVWIASKELNEFKTSPFPEK